MTGQTDSSILGVKVLAADTHKGQTSSYLLSNYNYGTGKRSDFDQSLNDRAVTSFDKTGDLLKHIEEEKIQDQPLKTDRAKSDNTGDWAITQAGKGKLIIEDFSSLDESKAQ